MHRSATIPFSRVSAKVAIIGGGVSALTAALAVAAEGRSIVLFEKRGGRPHKPSAQDFFCHAVLAGGTDAFERLCPGILADIVDGGGQLCDPLHDVRYVEDRACTPRQRSGYAMLLAPRPLIEDKLRERVVKLAGVSFERAKIADILPRADGRLSVVGGSGGTFDAVIDASGSEHQWPGLQGVELGSDRLEQPVGIEMVSAHFSLPVCPERRSGLLVFNAPPPQGKLGGQLMICGPERGQLSLGWRGTRRNVRELPLWDTFAAFAPDVAVEMASGWRQSSEVQTYRFREAYYHRAAGPERLGVPYFPVGDAQLKTNPAFGLGTSLAAISCLKLRNVFSARPAYDPVEAARRYAFACRGHLDTAWSLTTTTDGLYDRPEQVRGLGRALLNFMLGRLRARFIGSPALARRVILSAQLVVHDRPWFDPRFAVAAGCASMPTK